MVITGNTIDGTNDRVFRITDAGAAYVITGNTIVSNGNAEGELALAKNVTDASQITLSGNTWNGKADSEVTAGMVGSDYIVK